MFDGAQQRKIKFRFNAIVDQEPILPTIDRNQRDFIGHIQKLLLVLESVPTGRALLQEGIDRNVSVGLDPLLAADSNFFYPSQNHFDCGYQPEGFSETEKGQGRYLVSLISGLRRAWHHARDNSTDVSLKPQDFLRQFRCGAADIEAITHLIGWELRAAGHAQLWRFLLSGANGDIAVVFERAVEADPHALFDGRALRAAFNQWFAESVRVDCCDHLGLEIMDAALLQTEYNEKIGLEAVVENRMQQFGALPSGQNYLSGCHLLGERMGGIKDMMNRQHLLGIEQDIQRMAKASLSRAPS